ncbi:MAG: hypothetical protein PHH75_06920 [Candidatus Omnitrophica bacterium]|nr:hypothetical protein [Candidatus Omnitrophota bacterium]MDD5574893.1 hypothetical protein [Candidatus Omnitrophota bacterium]
MPEDYERFAYRTVVTWNKENKTFLCSSGNKTIAMAVASESGRHGGILTPEELFIDSIEGFIKETFMDHARRNNLEVMNYESEGRGIVKKAKGKLLFVEVVIRPQITVAVNSQIKKAEELIALAGKNCSMLHLIVSRINIIPEIKAGTPDDKF